jgi:hypothetical protein
MFCGVLQTPYHKLKMLLQSYEFEFNWYLTLDSNKRWYVHSWLALQSPL